MISSVERLVWSLGITLSMGAAFVPLGCGSSGEAGYDPVRPTHRDPPEVPERVVAQLTDCVKQTAASFPPAEGNMYAIQFNVHASKSGRVGAVEVKDSTLGGHGQAVEACMARVLEGSTLPVRATAMQRAPESRALPQSRALVANPAAGAAAGAGVKTALELGAAGMVEVVLSPAVLTGVGLIVLVAVVVYVATDKDSDEDERERCRKVNEACQVKCLSELRKKDYGANPFHKCMRECREAEGCWKGTY